MRLGTATAVAAIVAASIHPATGPAAAADMPSYYSPPASYTPGDAPQEFGAGWYLRGDAAFGPENRPKLLLRDDVPTFDRHGGGIGYAFGAGAGYQFTDWFRADLTGDYLDPFHDAIHIPCGSNCTIAQSSDVQRFDGLVNGYVDLGTYAGFTPYVGAGVGIAGAVQDGSVRVAGASVADAVDPRTGQPVVSRTSHRTDYGFAWAAMAGVSYAVAPRTLLDVGYRYLDLGRTTVSLLPSAAITRTLSTQEVRFGVRYMID